MNQKHNREEVLHAGLELICSKGYNNLGIDEICRSTGMTKGAFYNAFKSKENFLLEGIIAYGESTSDYLTKRLSDRHIKPIDRLRQLYDSLLDNQPSVGYRGCMINNMMSELGGINDLVGEATSTEFQHFIEVIEPCVIEAQQDGDLNPGINSRSLAELLHSSFFGVLTIAKSLQDFYKGKETMNLLFNALTKFEPIEQTQNR
jgi:TetR/AcrR family transcriptional repressor of nem operon